MSIWRVLLPVVMLGVVACADTAGPGSADDPSETAVDQAIGFPPSCPVGETIVFWEEPLGACGSCTINHAPGLREQQWAGCSGNPQGTKKAIQVLCENVCPLN